jgi:serine/threonine-protein kinase
MHEQVTLLRHDPRRSSTAGATLGLSPDLLDQVRGRVRLLAALLLVAFALDPVIYLGRWAAAALAGLELPSDFYARIGFQWASAAAVLASAALWWVARRGGLEAVRLHALGLAYEVVICFVIALHAIWGYYLDRGIVPNLTWVPGVVMLFPLILPGPPRRMFAAASAAAAMAPFALLVLHLTGRVTAVADDYLSMLFSSGFAVGFAYLGARVVYGLGRQVAAARELGSYRLEERLGEGGMGEVWRARHRMLARPAAIKVVRPALVGDAPPGVSREVFDRFEREAQAIARLRSPHTVELFDFGVADDGAFYYAMELLEGIDADSLVRRYGPVPAERAVYLLRQVCHSLSEADACGLVHRDIKPANIFLCRYGEDCDFVKVLDFGLVKAVHEPAAAGSGITVENAVYGTPAFIAPEQALGRPDLDRRVDIYATGCVAYWLLTGQLVFTAANPMGFLLQHANTAPTPPSTRTELPIPPALDGLVLACLAKDPAARPQSARELMARLDAVDGGNGWTEQRAREWWERHQPERGRQEG